MILDEESKAPIKGSDSEKLTDLFQKIGANWEINRNQSKIDSPTGSFIGVLTEPPSRYISRTTYVVFDFDPSGALVGIQINH